MLRLIYDLRVIRSLPIRAAVFDGDDTLWRTELLYDRARAAARKIVERQGVDPVQWEARQRIIDVENVSVYGFSPSRFPASCLQAFREVSSDVKYERDEEAERRIVHAAQSVFRNNPKRIPYATSVLRTLKKRSVRLGLLTKGDPSIQSDRIERSGLAPFFESIEIVPDKTPKVIRGMLKRLGALPSNAWMIGNSLRSDIVPALRVGVKGIWIDAPVWEYEKKSIQTPEALVVKARDIREVLEVIA